MKQQDTPPDPIDTAVRIGLIALLSLWCLYIAWPFVGAVVWGVIIAIGSYPLFRWMQKRLALSNGKAATLFTLIMLALLITPTAILTSALLEETAAMSEQIKRGELQINPPPEKVSQWPVVGEKLADFWRRLSDNPRDTLGELQPQLLRIGEWIVKAAASMGLGLLLFIFSIIIAGVFLAKAEAGHQVAVTILNRLVGDKGEELADLSKSTVRSVVNGILGIAVIQALLAGVGFMVMGIPGAGVLAFICLLLAVVQIDILIILIPLSIWAFSFAGTGAAVAFLTWNIGVGLMNNILKPIMLARGVQAPMAIIFVGAIGGLIAHGIVGLFVGAVVLVMGYTLFIWWLDNGKQTGQS